MDKAKGSATHLSTRPCCAFLQHGTEDDELAQTMYLCVPLDMTVAAMQLFSAGRINMHKDICNVKHSHCI